MTETEVTQEDCDVAITPEQCVIICPQCEGEGCYADGLDDAACSTICTRCESNGMIVDVHSYEYALARHRTQSAAQNVPVLLEALNRQCDNMAFFLNRFSIPDQWYAKMMRELEEDRAAIAQAQEPE